MDQQQDQHTCIGALFVVGVTIYLSVYLSICIYIYISINAHMAVDLNTFSPGPE